MIDSISFHDHKNITSRTLPELIYLATKLSKIDHDFIAIKASDDHSDGGQSPTRARARGCVRVGSSFHIIV